MATVSTKSKAAAAKKEAHTHADLEAKIADLEKKLAALTESCAGAHAELAAKCDACCAAAGSGGGGKDLELRSELKLYFDTVGNRKVDTHKPNLD